MSSLLPHSTLLDLPREMARVDTPLPPRQRSRISLRVVADREVDGRLELAELPPVQLARVEAGPHELRHAGNPAYSQDLLVLLQLQGVSYLQHEDEMIRLAPGTWCLCESRRAYSLKHETPFARLGLLCSSERMSRRIGWAGHLWRAFSGEVGASRVLCSAWKALWEELTSLEVTASSLMAESLLNLLQLALQEQGELTSWLSERLPLAERIEQYILSHLRDPQLSVERIAQALSRTPRALQHAARGESIRQRVLFERLARCHRDLTDPALRHQTIADIAQGWGFRDRTHFSTVFRARFGATPGEVRRAAVLQDAKEDKLSEN